MTTRRPIRRALAGLLAVALVLQGPGCAFLFHKNQSVKVTCNVPDAVITIDGKPSKLGTHPLRTGDDHTIIAEAPGYRSQTMVVKGRDDFAFRYLIFDSLWILAYGAGIVFLIVDLTTGTMWDHTPRGVDLVLLPERPRGAEVAARTPPATPPAARPRPDPPARPQPAPPVVATPVKPPPTPVKPPTTPVKTDRAPVAPPPPPPPPPGRTRILAVGAGSPGAEAAAAALCGLTAAADARSLTGAKATRQAILREVREHLERNVGRDDRAILYLGCGLSWDGDELYLTTADTDPDRLAQTAIPASTLASYLERVEGALVLVLVNGPIADTVPAANELALDGALMVVSDGDLARTVANGLRAGGADKDGDDRVSGAELSTWLEVELAGHGTVRGGSPGALPVQR